ncbi:variant SH3 domain-containing protein [Dactylonectria estremocensis]|uniref:Variant SH3 domain-containing protein n=1 Tax=Dactylonectria estremocensis TaxID=1079267 RepID=A0A9P9EV52_9HYPO|nr:variant SH3 domain-containing protein [Dactylonectria estremocensis]
MPLSHVRLHRRSDFNQEAGKLASDIGNGLNERDAVVKTVYVTADPTFKGKVGGYSTVGKSSKATKTAVEDEEPTTTAKAKVTSTAKSKAKTTSVEDEDETTTEAKSKTKSKTKETEVESETTKSTKTRSKTTTTDEATTTSVPSAISDPTATNTESVLFKASGQASMSTTLETSNINTATSALSSSSASAAASSSSGDSGPGTKAGIAFGVLGGIFIVGMLVFFIFTRRRKQADRQRLEEDDEKLNGPIRPAAPATPIGPSDAHLGVAAAVSSTPRTDPKAPRISLRPVTQFLPNWNLEKRTSKGAAMALAAPAAGGPVTNRVPGGSAWDRPTTAQSSDPSNPFGIQAERVATPIMEESISARSTSPNHDATRAVSPVSSIGTINTANDPLTAHGPQVAVAVAAATTAGSAMLAQARSDTPQPSYVRCPPSPAGTEFSINSAAPGAPEAHSHSADAIAAAGGPVNSAVHRVQLDFNPTMDDELELKAGDLVRLLHEYDDGWALCIRLDRSRQGVVPRTCLSTRPVKPRPAQGGPRPGPRGPMGPPGQRPMTPNGGGNQSPLGPSMNPAGRPMSPASRAQSPGPRQGPPASRSMSPGPRSQSPAPRRVSPPGPSPMNPAQEPRRGPPTGPVGRKPVPGQAY